MYRKYLIFDNDILVAALLHTYLLHTSWLTSVVFYVKRRSFVFFLRYSHSD